MTTMVTYSNDRGNKYLLTKKWDRNLPKVTVIMLMLSISGVVQQDMTTTYIMNCNSEFRFSSVDILRLFLGNFNVL